MTVSALCVCVFLSSMCVKENHHLEIRNSWIKKAFPDQLTIEKVTVIYTILEERKSGQLSTFSRSVSFSKLLLKVLNCADPETVVDSWRIVSWYIYISRHCVKWGPRITRRQKRRREWNMVPLVPSMVPWVPSLPSMVPSPIPCPLSISVGDASKPCFGFYVCGCVSSRVAAYGQTLSKSD